MKKDRGLPKGLLFIKKIFHPKLTHTGSVGKGIQASPDLITPPENPVQGAKPSHKDFRTLKKFSLLREIGKTREKLEILLCYFGHENKYFYVPQICTKTPPEKCVSKLQNWPEVCLYRPPKAIRVGPKIK